MDLPNVMISAVSSENIFKKIDKGFFPTKKSTAHCCQCVLHNNPTMRSMIKNCDHIEV